MIAAFSFRAWFPLSPGVVLAVLIALSIVAAFIDRASRRRRKRALRELAARWQMTYSSRTNCGWRPRWQGGSRTVRADLLCH